MSSKAGMKSSSAKSLLNAGKKKPPESKKIRKKETEEERLAREEREKEEKRQWFIETQCTTLNFKYLEREKNKSIICDRILTYMELQRQISHYNLKSKSVFMVQNIVNKEMITAENFKASAQFQVKEIMTPPSRIPKRLPALPIKWDFHNYHGREKDWLDPSLRIQRMKEAEAKRKKEAEDRAGWEAEIKFKEEQALKAKADNEWKDLLGI